MKNKKTHMIRVQNDTLFLEAKIYAVSQGISLIELTEKALKYYFEKKLKKVLD